MPHLRVPEMLVGALLAMAWSDGLLPQVETKLASRLSLLCLAVLFVCFFLTGVFTPPFFPGVASLIPCIATATLLYLNAQPISGSRLLSNPFVVWIGKISYSISMALGGIGLVPLCLRCWSSRAPAACDGKPSDVVPFRPKLLLRRATYAPSKTELRARTHVFLFGSCWFDTCSIFIARGAIREDVFAQRVFNDDSYTWHVV